MLSFPLPVTTPELHGFVEGGRWLVEDSAALTLHGWVLLLSGAPWKRIEARVDNLTVARAQPKPRNDVAAAYPDHAHAEHCSFELYLPLVAGDAEIHLQVVADNGTIHPLATLSALRLPGRSAILGDTASWLQRNLDQIAPTVPSWHGDRLLSVVIPVFDPDPVALGSCLDSLLDQTHGTWEALLVDDGCTRPEVLALLDHYVDRDRRFIRIHPGGNHGIARASNTGIEAARGEWIAFLDHDDRLRPTALARFAREIATHPGADVIYSDEEKITAEGAHHALFLKPGWSPTFLCGVMYLGHLLCVRRSLVRRVGGADPVFDGIQDFELALRLAEHTNAVRHIPEVLYQWRMGPLSSARIGNIKGDMDTRQRAAVSAHLRRRGSQAVPTSLGGHRLRLDPPEGFEPGTFFRVDAAATTAGAVRSAPESTAEYILFVGAAVAELSADAQRRLLFHAAESPHRLVAARLISRDGRVAESGGTVASDGYVTRLMWGFDAQSDGWHGSLSCHREALTCSGTAFAVHRSLWDRLRKLAAEAPSDDMAIGALIPLLSPSGPAVLVLANADAILKSPIAQVERRAGSLGSDTPFDQSFHPAFDRQHADYRLMATDHPPFRLHFDHSLPAVAESGCIRISGWCLTAGQQPLHDARVRLDDWTIPVVHGQPRPDLGVTFPEAVETNPGFECRFEVPPGRQVAAFEVRLNSEDVWRVVATQRIEVPDRSALETNPNIEALLLFQLGLHPRHPPRAVVTRPLPRPAPGSKRPALIVATPSYNQGTFLPVTTASVEDNDLDGVHHQVEDGGSTDETVAWLTSHPSPHRAWTSAPDAGQADAIVRAFSRTTGAPTDLMAWINADDAYTPGALDFVRDYFARHPEVDVLYGDRIVIDANGDEINRWRLPGHDPRVLELNDFVPQETLFWRRRAWAAVGGLDTTLHFALDWDLLLRFQAAGLHLVHVPEFLGLFRVHPQQKTSAQMQTRGRREIEALRRRTFGRDISEAELTESPALLAFLRASAARDRAEA